jgi:hypothetical protein
MKFFPRAIALCLLLLSSSAAFAEEFVQARCNHPNHHGEWRGPRRSGTDASQVFRDADEHNRRHHGHEAQVLLVAHG